MPSCLAPPDPMAAASPLIYSLAGRATPARLWDGRLTGETALGKQNERAHDPYRNQRALALALTLALALSGLLASGAAGQPQATVKLVPSTTKIDHGQTVAVVLRIEGVQNLYGAQADLHFDPSRLTVQDADPAAEGIQSALGSFLSPDFVVVNEADNIVGSLRLAFTQMAPNPPVEGNGDLATVTFEGIGSGEATLTWENVILADVDGQKINAHLEETTIQVGKELPIVGLLVGGAGTLGIVAALLVGRKRVAGRQSG